MHGISISWDSVAHLRLGGSESFQIRLQFIKFAFDVWVDELLFADVRFERFQSAFDLGLLFGDLFEP